MSWTDYIACFFAGVFFANAVPHFVYGVCGDRFPTPFARPRGRGLSSPTLNVAWALANIAIGYVLLRTGEISGGNTMSHAVLFAGIAALSLPMSAHFARKHAE